MWADVVGHGPAMAHLAGAVETGALPHALLLTGPDGVGKTTLAERVAGEMLMATDWPGGLMAHPDHWLEDGTGERIGIDRLRGGGGTPEGGPSLQDFFALRTYAGGRRVAVIGRADRLTEQAANCILKTLEEPPPSSSIILCAANPERMPATIMSRCSVIALAPVPAETVARWLRETHGVAPALASAAALLSGGRPGRAIGLATTPGALTAEFAAVDALLAAAGGGPGAALRAAGAVAPPGTAEGRERALSIVAAWTGYLRDVACYAAGTPELALWEHYAAAAASWSVTLGLATAGSMLARCVETTEQLAQYASPRLAFEVLLLDLLAADPAPPRTTAPPPDPDLAGPAESGRAARPTHPTTRARAPRRR